jgi:predicted esterase
MPAFLVLIFTTSTLGQELTEAQAKAVQTAVAQTGGELAALKAFDTDLELPSGLTKEQADAMGRALWSAYKAGVVEAGGQQYDAMGELPPTMAELVQQAEGGRVRIQARTMPLGEFKMPFTLIRREASGVPEPGRALLICTHGGGGKGDAEGPHSWNVNTREWQTQMQFAVQVYKPEGLYFVPRMADDRKGRWRHAHHQDQFELAIRHGILFWGVNPNRVYKLGISQGGFASAILGAFMPDLFAGINPMAAGVGLGNPAENLRNLPCYTSVGEKDTMFKRAPHAIAFHKRLDELREKDPDGYENHLDLQPGRGHGIDYRPGAPWIAKHTRNPHPEKVVWTSKEQDGRRRSSMYWLELQGDDLKGTVALTATVDREKNSVAITAYQLAKENAQGDPTQIEEQQAKATPLSGAAVSVLLNDELLDLDRPVTVTCNGEDVFSGKVQRDAKTLLQTMVRRGDLNYAFPARVTIDLE